MAEFCRCILFLTIVSVMSFFVGRLLAWAAPASCFRADRFPYRACRWEREGRLWETLRVPRWKDRVPDMSRLLSCIMAEKRLHERPDRATLEGMLRETCVAEWVHGLLALIGLAQLLLRKTWLGRALGLLYAFGNLPFMMIQRYNRPRLMRLHARMDARIDAREQRTEEKTREISTYDDCQRDSTGAPVECQYRRGT